jgi:hypothetical protein
MALAFVPSLDRVFQSSGLCRLELVAAAEARWMLSVEKQSKSKAREVRKLLKSRGVGLFGNAGPVIVVDRERAGRAGWLLPSALNGRFNCGSTPGE